MGRYDIPYDFQQMGLRPFDVVSWGCVLIGRPGVVQFCGRGGITPKGSEELRQG